MDASFGNGGAWLKTIFQARSNSSGVAAGAMTRWNL
jgi:hypothetical protein